MILTAIKQWAYERKLRKEQVPEIFRTCYEEMRRLDTKKTVREAEFIVLDTEATGLRPDKGDTLLSIAGIGLKTGRVDLSKSFYELIKPDREIPRSSVVIHHLTPSRFKDLPPTSDVLVRFFEFCRGGILVGHHVSFDVRFLNDALRGQFGITLANRVLDTALIARGIEKRENPTRVAMEGTRAVGLDELAKKFGIPMPDRHDAYGDALATAMIFQRQLGILERQGVALVKGLLRMAEVR
jgi:DNA polymerase-3 subunit epsilon